MTSNAIAKVFADTQSSFAVLTGGATNVQALSGDRIVMLTAEGETSDVLTVMMVKKKVINTVSEVTGEKLSVAVLTYDEGGIELSDGTKAVLYKSPTLPKPSRKGSKKVLGAPTKLSICQNIFLEDPTAAKADVCKRYQAEANCTRQGANTYYLLISKQHAAGELVAAVNGAAEAKAKAKASNDEAPAAEATTETAEAAAA